MKGTMSVNWLIVWAELLRGQADTLDMLADLVDREARPALWERARSHRLLAGEIESRLL